MDLDLAAFSGTDTFLTTKWNESRASNRVTRFHTQPDLRLSSTAAQHDVTCARIEA